MPRHVHLLRSPRGTQGIHTDLMMGQFARKRESMCGPPLHAVVLTPWCLNAPCVQPRGDRRGQSHAGRARGGGAADRARALRHCDLLPTLPAAAP